MLLRLAFVIIVLCSFSETRADRTALSLNGRTVLVDDNSTDSATDVKLVLAFHGLASSPKDMLDATGLAEKSAEFKFMLVAPEGQGKPFKGWDAGSCCLANATDNDVTFVNELIKELKSRYPKINLGEVYLIGFSNGAKMAYRLSYQMERKVTVGSTEHAVTIRGIATLSGTLAIYRKDLGPHTEPIPWIHFHGTADPVIGIDSARAKGGFPIETVAKTIEIVTIRNKATESQSPETIDTDASDGTSVVVSRSAPRSGMPGAPVVYVKVNDGGHTWPGHAPPPRFVELLGGQLGKFTKDINAENIIFDFFGVR